MLYFLYLGKKPQTVSRAADNTLDYRLPPQLELSMPVLFSAMSYGSISYNAHKSLALAASELGILYNTGEGGLHEDFTAMAKIPLSRLLPDALASMKTI